MSRRNFLRIGTLGLGGLSLVDRMRAQELRRNGAPSFLRDRSVVLLFLGGGPSHIETFDPHMEAPSEIRSATGEVPTNIAGVRFGGTFPRLAKMADRMAVVRTFQHPITDHAKAIEHVLTAGHSEKVSMGSLYTRFRGTNHEKTGFPSYVALTADEVDRQYKKEKGRIVHGSASGSLAPMYRPFIPSGNGDLRNDLELNIPENRLRDRRMLLNRLDSIKRRLDAEQKMSAQDQYKQLALETLLNGIGDAFDLSRESDRLIERYDTSRFQVGKATFRQSSLGTQLLMARRLCEAGCGFVTVQSAGWDMHADGNNPGIKAGMEMLGPPLDYAVSAFLEDVEQRGLSSKILLVITGDFGRTPKINDRGGRDHWSKLGMIAFAGGGLKMGQVVGQSDRRAAEPASDPVTPRNLMATIMHTVFDMGQLRVEAGLPSDLLRFVDESEPIGQLL